jgi:hypothetical protein
MEPASTIIEKLGGEAVVVQTLTDAGLKVAYTAPYRWQSARDKGGTGGTIPQKYHRTLLDYAREKSIPLSAEDFLPLSDSTDIASDDATEPERATS